MAFLLPLAGPYRFSRNPMYVAVLLILGGWAVDFRSASLANYAAFMAVIFYVRVVLFEEPWLADTKGDPWREYKRSVPRWVGRRRR